MWTCWELAQVVQPALGLTYPGVVLFAGVASTVKTKGHMVTIPPGKWGLHNSFRYT